MTKPKQKKVEEKEPFVRYDTKGKWRHRIELGSHMGFRTMLTDYSWDTKEQGEKWVIWNNFGNALYGQIVPNPDL